VNVPGHGTEVALDAPAKLQPNRGYMAGHKAGEPVGVPRPKRGSAMLQAVDVDHAAESLLAIGQIPWLRSGIVKFKPGLVASGWYESLDACELRVDDVWVPVCDGSDLADCRLKIETAIEDARREVTEQHRAVVEWVSPDLASEVEDVFRSRLEQLTMEAT